MTETAELIEAMTPLDDLVAKAMERMVQGPRMILDSFPNDPSFMSSSFSPAVVREIASRLSALQAENDRLREALVKSLAYVEDYRNRMADASEEATAEPAMMTYTGAAMAGAAIADYIRDFAK